MKPCRRRAISHFVNPFPKYLQIRQLLLRRLQEDLRPGDPFPTEQTLVREFGVSRETVREALRGLAKDGWIKRHRGTGTVVARGRPQTTDRRLTGLSESLSDLTDETRAAVLKKGIVRVPLDVAGLLNLQPEESTYKIIRVRSFQRLPLSYVETYMPVDIGLRMSKVHLERSSVMSALKDSLKLPYKEMQQTIDAVLADAEIASILGIAVGAPLLLLTRILVVGRDERPIVFRSRYRADRYYYTVRLGAQKRH
jgi:GntR family transcriptional regulator